MTTGGFAVARCPIDDDKAEAHYHKQEAYPGKNGGLEERRSDCVKESDKRTGDRVIIVGTITGCILHRQCHDIYSNFQSKALNM